MNGENINLTKGGGEVEELKIPRENVYSKDEVKAGSQLDYEQFGGSDKAESNYSHAESATAKYSAEAENNIEAFRYSRARLRNFGHKAYKFSTR